jgi:2'-5' RNA ligase
MSPPGARRLFLALWPDDAVRHALHHWQAHNLPGDARWQHRADLHMTLHFLGQVAADRLPLLDGIVDTLAADAFTLVLDDIGVWSRPAVAWAAPTSPPGELAEFHGRLGRRLADAGFTVETRTYRPHVTLARKVRDRAGLGPLRPLTWRVDEWALVESRPGRVPAYRPLRRRRLA